ncbi:MAG: CRISPR-associated endoribonuclease Cas6, partial [Planctomycetota bacterium]
MMAAFFASLVECSRNFSGRGLVFTRLIKQAIGFRSMPTEANPAACASTSVQFVQAPSFILPRVRQRTDQPRADAGEERGGGLNGLNGLNGFSFKASHISPFTFSFQIASPVDKFIQHLIEGIFGEGQEVRLGKQTFSVCRVETLADPLETTTGASSSNGLNSLNRLNGLNSLNGLNGLIRVSLKPLESPLFIKKPMPPGQQDIYLFPGDNGYEELLNQNLMHKYETLLGKPYQGETLKFYFLETKGKSVKQFTVFKKGLNGSVNPIHIKGTLQPFTVTGPKELIKIGLECGFGQNNSMGCGYVEINRDGQDRQDLRSATNEPSAAFGRNQIR